MYFDQENFMRNQYLQTFALFVCLSALVSFSAKSGAQEEEKAFAEHRFVLQLSDSDPEKQSLVLSVASNVMKHYGPDLVEVEIVAFGPGLQLLYKNNPNSDRIDGLVSSSGVRLTACGNTISTLKRTQGLDVELNTHARVFATGAVRIEQLVNQGYLLIRP
jgi:intracellular sulfur oxidation DsrE/DsrF family protein